MYYVFYEYLNILTMYAYYISIYNIVTTDQYEYKYLQRYHEKIKKCVIAPLLTYNFYDDVELCFENINKIWNIEMQNVYIKFVF